MSEIFKNGPRVSDVSFFDSEDGSGNVIFNWSGSSGFGQLSLSTDKDGNIHIDTEYMGKEFVREFFDYLVNNATYDTDIEPYEIVIKSWVPNQEILSLLKKAHIKEGTRIIKSDRMYLSIIKSLEDVGLNVMITNNEKTKVIFVDNKKFSQR